MSDSQLSYDRHRLTSIGIDNGSYVFNLEKQTVLDNILLIPGVSSPLSELKNLLFGQGQAGGIWVPSLSPAMISGNSFGTGVQTFLDLSGNGKNATQASSGSRPAWGRVPKSGKRQLLVNSGFLGAVSGSPGTEPTGWTRGGSPAGTQTYDPSKKSIRISVNGERLDNRQSIALEANTTYHFSANANIFISQGWVQIFRLLSAPAGSTVTYQQDDDASTTNGNLSPEVRNNTKLQITIDVGATAGTVTFCMGGGISFNGTSDVEFWEPQVEVASSRSAYQLSGLTTFDITESGQRDCYYLGFDGVDDFMTASNVDLSGTADATVFLAVRKRSDVALASILTHNGGSDPYLQLRGPHSNGGTSFSAGYRGSVTNAFAVDSNHAAPITRILTGTFKRNLPAVTIQVNDDTEVTTTTPIGGGNFVDATLNFGSTTGLIGPCAADIYGAILVSGVPTAATIARVKRILSRYTPEVSL